MQPNIRIENITEERISLWTEKGSCAELDRWPLQAFNDLNLELTEPVFWFNRLKAKVEGEGEGTKLMERLVQILDEKQITVVNGVNPYGSMNMEELKAFYRKYGFKDVKDDVMIRHPYSVMDNTRPCEGFNPGSSPGGDTRASVA